MESDQKSNNMNMGPDSGIMPDEYHDMGKRGKIYSKMAEGKNKHYMVDGNGNIHTVHLIPAKHIDGDGDDDRKS